MECSVQNTVFSSSLAPFQPDRSKITQSASTFFRCLERVKQAFGKDHKLIEALQPPPFLCQTMTQSLTSRRIFHITPMHPGFQLLGKTIAQLDQALSPSLSVLQSQALREMKDEYQKYMQLICSQEKSALPQLLQGEKYAPFHLRNNDPAGYYYALLESAYEEKCESDQILYLKKLGEVYLTKKDYQRAAHLFNGALAVAKKTGDAAAQQEIFGKLEETESTFLQELRISKQTVRVVGHLMRYHQDLANLRKKVELMNEQDTPIDEIQKCLTQGLQAILGALMSEALHLLGPAPTRFALIGFGSMSRKEMCPYSDIEFGILIKENDPTHLICFRKLAQLLELKFLNFSETEYKILRPKKTEEREIPAKSFTPKGFSMDIGGIAPAGVKGIYELIGTPQQLAHFQTPEWLQKNEGFGDILVNALTRCCFVVGSEELVKEYEAEVNRILDQKIPNLQRPLREERALAMLKGHLEEFRPLLDERRINLRAFDIKRDLYRPLQMILHSLALYNGLKEGNTSANIASLKMREILSEKGANQLKKVLREVLSLRLRAHLFYQTGQEILYFSQGAEDEEAKHLFVLDETTSKRLRQIYNVLILLHDAAKAFIAGDKRPLAASTFKEQVIQERQKRTADVQTEAFEKGFEEAKQEYLQRGALQPDNPEDLGDIAAIKLVLGEADALPYLQEQYKQLKRKHGETPHEEVALCLESLGVAFRTAGQPLLAIDYYRKALDMWGVLDKEDLQILKEMANTLNNLAVAYDTVGNLEEALKCAQQALAMREELYERDVLLDLGHSELADSLNCLGRIFLNKEEPLQALKYFKKALKVRRKLFKNQPHPDIAISLNNMGCALKALNQIAEAIDYYTQSMEMEKVLFKNKPHPHISLCLQNLGSAYLELDDKQKAHTCLQDALKMQRQLVGSRPDLQLASTLGQLGIACHKLGKTEEAVKHCTESLKIRQSIFKEQPHPSIAGSLFLLGSLFYESNHSVEATRYYQQFLEVSDQLKGEASKKLEDMAFACNNLGLMYEAKGQLTQAYAVHQRALELRQKVFGKEPHRAISNSLHNLASILDGLGKSKEAIEYYNQSLAIDRLLFGNTPHPAIATTLNNLGQAYFRLRDLKTARLYSSQALEMRKKLYKDQPHSETITSLINLGSILKHSKQLDESLKYYLEGWEMVQKLYGSQPHREMASALNHLGAVYQVLRNYPEALKYHVLCLEVEKKLCDTGMRTYDYLADAFGNVAACYYSLGNLSKAKEYTLQALSTQQELFQTNSNQAILSDLMGTLSNLGLFLKKLGEVKLAITYLHQLLDIRQSLFKNIPHEAIADSFNVLGAAYLVLPDLEKAKEYYMKCLEMQKQIYQDDPRLPMVKTLKQLGIVFEKLKDINQAIVYYAKSLAVNEDIGKYEPDKATIESLERLLGEDKSYEERMEILEKLLK